MKLLLTLVLLFSAIPASAAPLFQVTAVGLDSVAGINDQGQIVGTVNTESKHKAEIGVATDFQQVAVWTPGKTKILREFAHKPDCTPSAISNRGEIVASADQPDHYVGDGDWSDIILFRWRQGRFSRMSDSGEVHGLNNRGQAVGFRVWPDGEYGFMAWHGKVKEIRNPLSVEFCEINSINDTGLMAGVVYVHIGPPEQIGTSSERHYAYLWPPNGKPYCIETLPKTVFSEALGINNTGQVIGYVHFKDDWAAGENSYHVVYNDRAFLWQRGKMTLLDQNQPDILDARPVAINNAGEIVGSAYLPSVKSGKYLSHPFLYQNGVLFDLNTLIPANLHWELQTVSGINNRGQIIGSGLHNGKTHAFLLTPSGQAAKRP